MIYYMYETKNTLNGMIYIGVHSTNDENDGYMGSGKRLKHAIKTYGRENFKKTILEIFSSEEDMYERESEIVDKSFVLREDTYNIGVGGRGGFKHTLSQEEINDKLSSTIKEQFRNGRVVWNSGKKMDDKYKDTIREGIRNSNYDFTGENNPMYGKPCYYKMNDIEYDSWRTKIKKANTGKVRTDEAKKKYSDNAKNRIWIVSTITGKASHASSFDDPRLLSGEYVLGKKLK